MVKSLLFGMPIQSVFTMPISEVGGVVSLMRSSNDSEVSLPLLFTVLHSTISIPEAKTVPELGGHANSRDAPVALVAVTWYNTKAHSGAVALAITSSLGTIITGNVSSFVSVEPCTFTWLEDTKFYAIDITKINR